MPMFTALHANPDAGMGFAPAAQAAVKPGAPAQPASMQKVVLLVGLAIVIFMAFTAYSVRKEIQGGLELAAIKELYFPVLQRLDANSA